MHLPVKQARSNRSKKHASALAPAPIQAHISAVDKAIDAELAARAGRQPCL
jgi:hypothetical protein